MISGYEMNTRKVRRADTSCCGMWIVCLCVSVCWFIRFISVGENAFDELFSGMLISQCSHVVVLK